MNIFLLGYMGSGKSTIGKILAKKMVLNFLDFDDYLEEKEGRTINEIFAQQGEIYFRKLETRILKEIITKKNDTVISLGGGTPCYGNNMKLIKNTSATSVYINVSVKELSNRLWEARAQRPLLAHQDTPQKLEEYVRKHLFERSFYYNQAALKITAADRSALEIAQEIQLRFS